MDSEALELNLSGVKLIRIYIIYSIIYSIKFGYILYVLYNRITIFQWQHLNWSLQSLQVFPFICFKQSLSFYFYLPNHQEDRNAGQVKWVQPHLRNRIQQIFSPRIWPPWPHKGENRALRHWKKYCNRISNFFHSWRAWSTLILLTAMENPIWRTPESTLKQEFM